MASLYRACGGCHRVKPAAGQVGIAIQCVLLAALAWSASATAQAPAGVPAAAPASAAMKIGYVDIKRLVDNSPQMIEAKARLTREFSQRDESIKADDAKLAALKLRYERDNAIMTKTDAEALKREIDASERANKRMKDEARAEINARSAAESNRILNLIQDTAIEYARAQGYDLVVPSPVVYANPRIDITDAVLQRLKTLGAGTAKP
ncbi:MAG: OmpH family outer membrane protein [Gammaproteobacteria bacterium]|nr:MAG: OmpH family outer membrane protein [Gammaproteobacteria bacterium]